MIEQAIYTVLTNATAVTDIVDDGICAADTLRGAIDSPTLALSYDKTFYSTLTGVSELEQCRLQVACLATTKLAALELADAVRGVLDNYSGTVGSVVIDACLIQSASETPNLQPEQEKTTYGITLAYTVWHK